jgi:hypothetical protein
LFSIILLGTFSISICRGEEKPKTFILSGRLVHPDGSPVSGCPAALKPMKTGSFPEAEKKEPVQIKAGPDGAFRFDSLLSGVYGLTFQPQGAPGQPFHFEVDFGAILSRSVFINEVDMDLADLTVRKAGTRVVGKVFLQGVPRAHAEVFLLDPRKDEKISAMTDPEGSFTLDLAHTLPGEDVTLMARSGFGPEEMSDPKNVKSFGFSEERISAPWSTLKLDIHLLEARERLEGVVQDEKGNPCKGITIYLFPGNLSSPHCWIGPAQTGEDGRFVFNNIMPGRWKVCAAGKGALRTWKKTDIHPGEKGKVEIRLEPEETGSFSNTLNYRSYGGEYIDLIKKTTRYREKNPAQIGYFLCDEKGDLKIPRIPVGIIYIKEEVPEISIPHFKPGEHFLRAMPIRIWDFKYESHVNFFVIWKPVEYATPLGGLNAHVLIGPFQVRPREVTTWKQIPEVLAKAISKSSAEYFPYESVPQIIVKTIKEGILKEILKSCRDK